MKSGQGESVIGHITRQWQLERPDLDLGDFLLAIYLRRLGQLIENEYDRMCQARFGMSARDMRGPAIRIGKSGCHTGSLTLMPTK